VRLFRRIFAKQTYTPEEVAGLLGVSLATIYRYLDEGKLPEIRRVGKPRRIPMDKFHEMYPELKPPVQLALFPFSR